MTRRIDSRRVLAFVCLLTASVISVGQVSTGVPPFSSTAGGPDVVNLGNLNVHLSIPVLGKPGRGIPFNYALNYDSSVWYPISGVWQPTNNWGWVAPGNGITGGIQITTNTGSCIDPDSGLRVQYLRSFFKKYYDTFGSVHPIIGAVVIEDSLCGPQQISNGTTNDGSGYTIVPLDSSNAEVFDRSGKQIDVATSGTVQDSNGNEITAVGNNFYDTLSASSPVLAMSGGSPNPLVYTYKDTTGTARTITVSYLPHTVQTNFQCSGIQNYPAHANTYLVDRVTYDADGSYYQFSYEATPGISGAVTGRLASVRLRTGGTINYSYTGANNGIVCADGTANGLDRQTPDGTWHYSRSNPSGTQWTTSVQYPDASNSASINFQSAGGNFYETKRTILQGTQTAQTTFTCYNGAGLDCSATALSLPIGEVNVTTQLDSGQQSRLDTFYDSATGLPTRADEYDFGTGNPGALLKRTLTTYKAFSDNADIKDHPASVTVQDGAGHQQSLTTYAYDEFGLSATSIPQHVGIGVSRGNPTTISKWLNTTGSNLSTKMTYDDTGNVLSVQDPKLNTTSYSYSPSNSSAYLTQVDRPNTVNSSHHIASASYDSSTGLVLTATDENSNVTQYAYDALLRPNTITFPDSGSLQYIYTSTSVETRQKLDIAGNVTDQTTYLDGLGRPSQTVLVDPEGNDSTETSYDANGRVHSVTNPHRAVAAATDGTTLYSYDALGRVISIAEPDGSSQQTSYSGNAVTTTDEASRPRKTLFDGLGRVSQVIEPNPGSGSLTSGTFSTSYGYSVTSGGATVLTITQSGDGSQTARNRTLTYDSLARLASSSAPESGLVSYQYDPDGNATQVADARSVTTTIQYDALNRSISKSYSDGTPAVTLNYDEASPWGIVGANNTVGRLSSTLIAGNLAGSAFIYDKMGRIVRNDQCGKSICGSSAYPVFAGYDLAGNLTSFTYPSGRKIVNSYNNAAHLLKVNYDSFGGTTVNSPYYTVAQGATSATWGYLPAGGVVRPTFGNGVFQTLSANNRLQINQITTSTAAQTLLSKTYSFNSPNNGNITQISDSLNSGRTQNFSYDYLNRLTAASTAATTGSDSWSESYTIDPWGNAKQFGGYAFNPNFDVNNRISQTGYSYDASGNLLTDTFHTYAYDGEGRMKSVDSTAATYIYGADGQRSRKDISGDYTEYVYFGGQAIAEKNLAGDWTDYVFANGRRIAKAEALNRDLHIYGSSTGASQYAVFNFANTAGLSAYTIATGDTLYLAQYQPTGSKGGVLLSFTDGTNSNWLVKDKEGYFLNDDQKQNTTHFRSVDLSSLAGKTINKVAVNDETDTASGAWHIYFDYVSLVSADGSVHPIYSGQTSTPIVSITKTSGVTGAGSTIDTNRGKATNVADTTTTTPPITWAPPG